MPPFAAGLGDEDSAVVLNCVRYAWGNRAGAVPPVDAQRWHSSVGPDFALQRMGN